MVEERGWGQSRTFCEWQASFELNTVAERLSKVHRKELPMEWGATATVNSDFPSLFRIFKEDAKKLRSIYHSLFRAIYFFATL